MAAAALPVSQLMDDVESLERGLAALTERVERLESNAPDAYVKVRLMGAGRPDLTKDVRGRFTSWDVEIL